MAAAAANASHNPRTTPQPDSFSPDPAASQMGPSSAPAAPGHLPPLLRSTDHGRSSSLPCWGVVETLALIEAYGAKWCELRRGNLRASHWQEVADAVRRRCQRLGISRTAVQCRHKVEKLRQRYRAEKQRIALRGNGNKPRLCPWIYFPQMDAMEVGDDTSTPRAIPSSSLDDDGNGGRSSSGGKTKNEQHTLQLGFTGTGGSAALEFRIPKASRSRVIVGHHNGAAKAKARNGWFFKGFSGAPSWLAVDATGKEREVRPRKTGALVWEMVAAVNMLGDEFTRVEKMKMEMARDMEKLRKEMESKRTELMVQSQRQLLDCIARAASSPCQEGGQGSSPVVS